MVPRVKTSTRALYNLIAKLASLVMLFGGPLLVSDALRARIDPIAAVLVTIVPVVLFYMGADALVDPDRGRSRATFLRLGILGACVIAPMNAFAIARLVRGGFRFGVGPIAGALICALAIVTYLVLARRALQQALSPTRAPEDLGGPIG